MHLKKCFALLVILFSLLCYSCGGSNTVLQREEAAYFEEQLKAIITEYIRIKNALVNDNSEIAAREARALRFYLDTIVLNKLDAQVQKFWIDKEKYLREQLAALGTTQSLHEQRLKFHQISNILIDMVEEFGPVGLVLYKQYCQDALEGEGAAWINEVKEIQNPYAGGLHCGKVVERFSE